MVDSLKNTLIKRDGITEEEAESQISDARSRMMELLEEGNMDEAYNICMDEFGLEPDYLMDLL